jgi:hypothetical protein
MNYRFLLLSAALMAAISPALAQEVSVATTPGTVDVKTDVFWVRWLQSEQVPTSSRASGQSPLSLLPARSYTS